MFSIIIRIAIVAFFIFVVLAFIYSLTYNLPFFPSDKIILKEDFTFKFPLYTTAALSIVGAVVLWFLKKV